MIRHMSLMSEHCLDRHMSSQHHDLHRAFDSLLSVCVQSALSLCCSLFQCFSLSPLSPFSLSPLSLFLFSLCLQFRGWRAKPSNVRFILCNKHLRLQRKLFLRRLVHARATMTPRLIRSPAFKMLLPRLNLPNLSIKLSFD